MDYDIIHIPNSDLMFTSLCNLRCKYCFEGKEKKINLDFEDYKHYLEVGGTLKFFVFGGEPFMNPKFLEDFFHFINTELQAPANTVEALRQSTKNIITNGTLIHKHIDLIKKYNLHMQISLDGIKEAHDMNRVDTKGEGTWDKIMENIKLCADNQIDWSAHGVITRSTLPYLARNVRFYFELYVDYAKGGIKEAIRRMNMNIAQVIFEEDWTDEDTDIFIEQIYEACEYWMNHPYLTREQKREVVTNFLTRRGGKCGAGTALLAVDSNMDVFPCHRQADNSDFDHDNMKLGSLYKGEDLKNFKVYNTYHRIGLSHRMLYGYKYFNNAFQNGTYYWSNWCPSTNSYTSGNFNPYYVNSKYTVMHNEVDRFINKLLRHYRLKGGIKDGSRRPNNRHQHKRNH